MKRVYVNEEWCLGCHLCEYNCAFANSGLSDMALALKGKKIFHGYLWMATTAFILQFPAVIAKIPSASKAVFPALCTLRTAESASIGINALAV